MRNAFRKTKNERGSHAMRASGKPASVVAGSSASPSPKPMPMTMSMLPTSMSSWILVNESAVGRSVA